MGYEILYSGIYWGRDFDFKAVENVNFRGEQLGIHLGGVGIVEHIAALMLILLEKYSSYFLG